MSDRPSKLNMRSRGRRRDVKDHIGRDVCRRRNATVSASNGVDYAYRITGESAARPLVLLQHFRGNLDNWDPALIDALARAAR